MTDRQIERLRDLCSKLLKEVQLLTEDRSDSNLPEWESEARSLGIEPYDYWKHPHGFN